MTIPFIIRPHGFSHPVSSPFSTPPFLSPSFLPPMFSCRFLSTHITSDCSLPSFPPFPPSFLTVSLRLPASPTLLSLYHPLDSLGTNCSPHFSFSLLPSSPILPLSPSVLSSSLHSPALTCDWCSGNQSNTLAVVCEKRAKFGGVLAQLEALLPSIIRPCVCISLFHSPPSFLPVCSFIPSPFYPFLLAASTPFLKF